MQWKNTELLKGIAQFSMTLDEEPPLGMWHIHAMLNENNTQQEKVSFTVSEKVLPKFEVTIVSPKFIYRDAVEEEFKICAMVEM